MYSDDDQLDRANEAAKAELGGSKIDAAACTQIKTVTPVIELSAPWLVRGADGNPREAVVVTMRVDVDHPEIEYEAQLAISRSAAGIQLLVGEVEAFSAGELAHYSDKHKITVSEVVVVATAKGTLDGSYQLALEVEPTTATNIRVAGPAHETIEVVTINRVTPVLQPDAPTLWYDPSGTKTHHVILNVGLEQSNRTGGWGGTATVARSAPLATFHQRSDGSDSGFLGADQSRALDARELADQGRVFCLQARQPGEMTVSLTLTEPDPADPRVEVAGPATTTISVREVNRVTPTLTVERSLLLLEADGTQAQPSVMSLGLSQTKPDIGIEGCCCRLRRGDRCVEIYVDGAPQFGDSHELVIEAAALDGEAIMAVSMQGQSDGMVDFRFAVDDLGRDDIVVVGPAAVTVEVATINEVTPSLELAEPTLWHDSTGRLLQPVGVTLGISQSNEAIPYEGGATMIRDCPLASLHSQSDGRTEDGWSGGDEVPLVTAELLQGREAYLLATGTGSLTVSLALSASDNPRIRVRGPAVLQIAVLPLNRVTPCITVDENLLLLEPGGEPTNAAALCLQVRQTAPGDPLPGKCYLSRSGKNIAIYQGEHSLFGDADQLVAEVPAASLSPGSHVDLQLRGNADGQAELGFTIDDPNLPGTVIDGESSVTVEVATINVVTPVLVPDSPTLWHDPDGQQRQFIGAMLRVTQSNPAFPYTGTTTLTRSGPLASLHTRAEDPGEDAFGAGEALESAADALLAEASNVLLTAVGVGELALTLGLSASDDPRIRVADPVTTVVSVRELNRVTANIEVEYTVLPRARAIGGRRTDLVRAEVWITQTQPGVGYTGGLHIERSNDKLRAYVTADGTGAEQFGARNTFDIANDAVGGGQRLVMYLEGADSGTVSLTVKPQALGLPNVREADAVTIPMAVVDLVLELHRDVEPPDRGAMPSPDKVTVGGLVAVQNPEGQRGRRRLRIPKPSADLWAVGPDYEVLVSVGAAHGAIALFDQAAGGVARGLPVRLGVADFAAGPLDLWIEGQAPSGGWRDIELDIGLDRPPGGLAKAVKHGGDRACITVFEVSELTPTAAQRQYINLDVDHDHHPAHGRAYRAQATLTPALEGVAVMFKLLPDPNNRAGLPDGLRHQDPHAPVRAATDATGVARGELLLSRYGGDVFEIGAYLEQDAAAGALHPTKSAPLTVWRAIDYQIYCMARFGGGDFRDRIDEAAMKTVFSNRFVELRSMGADIALAYDRNVPLAGIDEWVRRALGGPYPSRTVGLAFIDSILADPRTEDVQLGGVIGAAISHYPLPSGAWFDLTQQIRWLDSGFQPCYQVTGGVQGALQDIPQAQAPAAYVPAALGPGEFHVDLTAAFGPIDFELKVRLIRQDTNVVEEVPITMPSAAPQLHVAPIPLGYIVDPSNWFVSLQVAVSPGWHLVPLARVGIVPANDQFQLNIDLQTLPPDNTYDVQLRLVSYPSDCFKGVQCGVNTAVALRTVETTMVGQENATAQQIAQHEIGHFLGLGSREVVDGSVNHNFYDNPGIGPHCNSGPDTCVMRHDLTNPPNTEFCAVCDDLVRARDLSNPRASAEVPFPG